MRIYVNKTENRITFRIKTECYLELLTHETMQLLGSAKNKITKDESNEKIVLVHGNRPKTYIFLKTFDLEFS